MSILFKFLAIIGLGVVSDSFDKPETDVICGPRVAHFVVQYFGEQAESLNSVVQALAVDADGVSMGEIADFLVAHGISTSAVDPGAYDALDWPFPVIAHIQVNGEKHFVVWHPESDQTRSLIWDGLEGYRWEPAPDFHRKLSAGCLLTWPARNKPSEAQGFCWSHDRKLFVGGWAAICLQVMCVVLLLRSK